jgi:hypothetical protein
MTPVEELRHLRTGPDPDERPGNVGVVSVVASCRGDADTIAQRAREVMVTVVSQPTDQWATTSDDRWQSILPDWFVAACATPQSAEDAERWLSWWRSLPADEQPRAAQQRAWTLADWLYWLHPGERQWFWWNATIVDSDTLRVTVEVLGWPAPIGALRWLLTAAGAVDVSEPD